MAKRCSIRSVRVSIFLRGIALAFDLSTQKNSECDYLSCFSNLLACSYLNGLVSVHCTYCILCISAKWCYGTCSLFMVIKLTRVCANVSYAFSIFLNVSQAIRTKLIAIKFRCVRIEKSLY